MTSLTQLATKFHKKHTLDGENDYTAAAAYLVKKGLNPWAQDPKGKTLACRVVHFFEKAKKQHADLSSDIDWDA
jgi:hypothetical protein